MELDWLFEVAEIKETVEQAVVCPDNVFREAGWGPCGKVCWHVAKCDQKPSLSIGDFMAKWKTEACTGDWS